MIYASVNAQMTDGQFKAAAEKLARKHGLQEYAKIEMLNARNGKRVRFYEAKNGVANRVNSW